MNAAPPASTPRAPIESMVRAEQVRTQYASMPTSFLGSVFSATLYVVAAHGVLPTSQWLTWWGLMIAQALARATLWQAFRRRPPRVEAMDTWGRRATLGSAVSGCIWGMGAWLVFPEQHVEFQLFFMFLIASMGSLSAIASASFLPAFYAFTYPTVLPVGLLLVTHPDRLLQAMGVISLGYLPVISRFAHTLGNGIVESFRLRFENLDLLREVTHRKEQAEDANREKSMFLAAASHDLRQPMHALALQAHLLGQTALDERQRQMLGGMRGSIDAMTGLFDALLDISRLEAGVVQPRVSDFAASKLLDRIALEFGPQAQAKGLRLVVRGSDAVLRSDLSLLQALLDNLVSNAIRYTARGGVLVSVRPRGDQWLVQVWDTGVGIDATEQREVFKPFYQVGNPERDRTKGLGLGLAIVDRLSALLQAPVTLRSVPGRGSVFSLRVDQGAAEPVSVPAEFAQPGAPASLEGRTVVVVDNEAEIRAATALLFESWGSTVITAGSGAQAIARTAALTRAPDLLVCDYRLGDDTDGLEVIGRLREEFNSDIPAVLITGDTAANLLQTLQESATAVVHKPLDPERLRALAQRLLAGS